MEEETETKHVEDAAAPAIPLENPRAHLITEHENQSYANGKY